MNNCRLPIVVGTSGAPDGSPKGEEGLMNETIVAFDLERGIHGIGILADGTTEPKILKNATPEELPHQYGIDVGMQRPIAPGQGLLFSVPINHVGEQWYFRIPFELYLETTTAASRPADAGGLVSMEINYTMYDLPPEAQATVKAWYAKSR